MFIVSIVELATAPEVEAQALAGSLGGTAYEHRLRLSAGSPANVLMTADRGLAAQTLAQVRARKHGAVLLDGGAVLPSERMISMRHFRLDSDSVALEGPPAARLPASDVLCLLRALHRTRTDTRAEVKTKSFSLGRTLATGGLMVSKSVKREEHSSSAESEPVLYVFRASGETPWILRERSTNYSALGSELGPSSMQNFLTTVRRLRALAPDAVYDERLLSLRVGSGPAAIRRGIAEETMTSSTASAIDIAAHLLALWIRER
ncbi:MAG TPA: hypothetical protein VK524_17645 [Polyangiaceae bacterium]|nr:hypothetical protein [Polyangiaceae bacterium]